MAGTLAFIGGGHMTTSLITGLIDSGYDKNQIIVADPNAEKLDRFKNKLQILTETSDVAAAQKANIIILAVKPQDMKNAIQDIAAVVKKQSPLLISIAAGVKTNLIEKWLQAPHAIVRAMPNTPALLRAGVSALYANSKVDEEQKSKAESILRAVGVTVWVSHEHDMDTVTALSGSGPAYFFLVMEALQQGAKNLGLPSETAKLLTLQTALGAARMALESDIPIEELTKRVASKGGVTEKALDTLESGGIRYIFNNALKMGKERAEEISQHLDQ